MTGSENLQPANTDNPQNLESQTASVPTEFPPLDPYELDEGAVDPSLMGLDFANAAPRWQIEQRLGAINDARANGSIAPDVADQLELDALRKMREMIYSAPPETLKISLADMHTMTTSSGQRPVNVSKPEPVWPADYKLEF